MRLTRKAFKAWLASLGPRRIAGYAGVPCNCPVSRFLGEGVEVLYASHKLPGKEHRDNPVWATTFIEKVDEDREGGQRVTAATALRILEETS